MMEKIPNKPIDDILFLNKLDIKLLEKQEADIKLGNYYLSYFLLFLSGISTIVIPLNFVIFRNMSSRDIAHLCISIILTSVSIYISSKFYFNKLDSDKIQAKILLFDTHNDFKISVILNYLISSCFILNEDFFANYKFVADLFDFLEIILHVWLVICASKVYKIALYSFFLTIFTEWIKFLIFDLLFDTVYFHYNFFSRSILSLFAFYFYDKVQKIDLSGKSYGKIGTKELNYLIDSCGFGILSYKKLGDAGFKLKNMNKTISDMVKEFDLCDLISSANSDKHLDNKNKNESKDSGELFLIKRNVNLTEDIKVRHCIETLFSNLEDLNKSLDQNVRKLLEHDKTDNRNTSFRSNFDNFHNNNPSFHKMSSFFKPKNINLYDVLEAVVQTTQIYGEFITLGTAKLKFGEESRHYAIKFKLNQVYIPLAASEEINEYCIDFLINDISNSLQLEKVKGEIQYKSLFLAKIAHEFKNPIITISSLCKDQLPTSKSGEGDSSSDDEEDRNASISKSKSKVSKYRMNMYENNNFILNLCNYLFILIEDLNTFVKLERDNSVNVGNVFGTVVKRTGARRQTSLDRLQLTDVDLYSVLDFCVSIFIIRQNNEPNKQNIKIHTSVDSNVPRRVLGIETKLKQIIVNLLSNAYKFTLSGEILLTAQLVHEEINISNALNYNNNNVFNTQRSNSSISGFPKFSNNNVSYPGKPRMVRISVSDTGLGISEEEKANLFTPFKMLESNQKHNVHGSGLGLLIVRELLHQIGSKIEMTSEKGKGTVFWFDLPESKKKTSANILSEISGNVNNIYGSNPTVELYSENSSSVMDQNCIYTESMTNLLSVLNSGGKLDSFNLNSSLDKKKKSGKSRYKFIEKEYNIIILESACEDNNSVLSDSNVKKLSVDDFVEEVNLFLNKLKKSSEKNVEKVAAVMRKFSSKNNLRNAMRKNYKNIKNDSPVHSDESAKDPTEFNKDAILEAVKNYTKTNNNPNNLLKHNLSDRESDVNQTHLAGFVNAPQINPIQNQLLGKSSSDINIMICDDDSNITAACEKVLKSVGHTKGLNLKIDKCHNGIECLYKIYQESRNNRYYEILFIDETMPVIKGSAVIKVLKNMIAEKQMKDMLIYSVTSYGEESAVEEIRKSGCDGVISKPMNKETALKALKELKH